MTNKRMNDFCTVIDNKMKITQQCIVCGRPSGDKELCEECTNTIKYLNERVEEISNRLKELERQFENERSK